MRAFGSAHDTWRRPLAGPPWALGAAAPPAEEIAKYTSAAAPIVSALVEGSDATASVETLRAKIKNHARLRDTFPEPLKTLYANKVRVLKSKLKAALVRQARDVEDRSSKKEWSVLGKVAVVTGIITGGALILFIVAGARRVGRAAA